MAINSVLVIGSGGVGVLVATLLAHAGKAVTTLDQEPNPALTPDIRQLQGDATDEQLLDELFPLHDAVISCLPFHLTLAIATAAHKAGIHYFDPTEDVATTQAILELAQTSKGLMIPQNGLAPGFIGILASHLAQQFDGKLRHIKMRVGALPENPIGQLGYAGNWSLEGLVHECIADCDVIVNSKRHKIGPLKNRETLRIKGVEYEAFTTSGGLGTMTETYDGKVETLNYKSIRYPGHMQGMKLLLEELRFREDPVELVRRLAYALPPDDNDRVLIHCSVQGEADGRLQTREIVTDYKPKQIGDHYYTAIAWTTAASISAVVEMASNGTLGEKGFVRQEDISLSDFLETSTGRYYLEGHEELERLI